MVPVENMFFYGSDYGWSIGCHHANDYLYDVHLACWFIHSQQS